MYGRASIATGEAHDPARLLYAHYLEIAAAPEHLRDKSRGASVIALDYHDSRGGRLMACSMAAPELIRRLFIHVFPKYFCKVRHHSMLTNFGHGVNYEDGNPEGRN